MEKPFCTLYTFSTIIEGKIKPVKVARLTDAMPVDWYLWAEERHPNWKLLEIAGIEFVDERGATR